MNLTDKIKSIRDVVGEGFRKPDPTVLETYREDLKEGALDYLHGRGLSDETIQHFQLGYDKERDAISIPVFKNKELVNIKYRYLNPDKIRYTGTKGAETWLYNEDGIQNALKVGSLLIVEGEFDAMMAWQRGFKNVVSPASGKDSYGVWLEMIDAIPKVYIAYDNDKGGRDSSASLAERIGLDKCFSVEYPDDTKDANEYFLKYEGADFLALVKKAKPFYSYQYKGLADIIQMMREDKGDKLRVSYIPKVEMEKGWLVVVSGVSNIGKTSYVLNIANEIADKDIPTLVLPFERGIESVGKRFLQVKENKTAQDFQFMNEEEAKTLVRNCVNTPIYFALPKKDEITETIVKAKRLFNTQVVIIDHLDYVVRHVSGNKENEITDTLQDLKRVAEENGIIMIIVTHLRKIDAMGATTRRKPNIEDLKGSSSLYQDPECVVMLSEAEEDKVSVEVLKNKGEMTFRKFDIKRNTGRMTQDLVDKEFDAL